MSRTHAAIVTYQNPALEERCLTALRGQCFCYVCDNSPPAENLLYTAGINEGILDALEDNADFILICCDDVIVRPGAVAALEKCLDENPKAAIAMPIQVTADDKVTCGGCVATWPVGTHIAEPLGSALYANGPFETHWANGACFLLRAEAVRECGLLDENMRFVCSDSDYSLTLRSRGWKIMVAPDAIVQHEPRGALQTSNDWLERIKAQDMLHFMQKWLTGGLFQKLDAAASQVTARAVQDRYRQLTEYLASHPEK